MSPKRWRLCSDIEENFYGSFNKRFWNHQNVVWQFWQSTHPLKIKGPATQRHSLLLRSHVTETQRLPPKNPALLECAIRPICTITMLPRWQHQFSPLKNGSPPRAQTIKLQSVSISSAANWAWMEKLYHCLTEYVGNHLNGAGKTNQPQKGP